MTWKHLPGAKTVDHLIKENGLAWCGIDVLGGHQGGWRQRCKDCQKRVEEYLTAVLEDPPVMVEETVTVTVQRYASDPDAAEALSRCVRRIRPHWDVKVEQTSVKSVSVEDTCGTS